MVNTKHSYNAVNVHDAFRREMTNHSFAISSLLPCSPFQNLSLQQEEL